MKAMVLRGTELTVEDVAKPAAAPGLVLARVLACGICGSDLHAAKYMDDMIAAAKASGRRVWYDRDHSAGIVMGHEFVAEIVESGAGVEGWEAGTRVTSMPVVIDPASETGFRSIGYSPEIPGAYSEYVVMSASLLLRVPDSVSDVVAATTEPCAVGLHAVRQAAMSEGQSALVMGAGPIGLMTLLWLKHDGVRFVAISDYSPERRALAARLGADLVIDPATENVADTIAASLEGLGAATAPGANAPAPDVVFECVGVQGTLEQAMELVQARGQVIVVGVCMKADTIQPMVGINKQLRLAFVLGYTPDEYAGALEALGNGSIDTAPLVTRTVGIDDLPATFLALADPKDCKVVVVPGGPR
ncbi:MAG: zinc-binding dehydrogenase [Tepidiformaceae bacterium]